MSKLKKTAILLIILFLLVVLGINVNATNGDIDLGDLLGNSLSNETANTELNTTLNETTNTETNTQGNEIIQPDTNKESTSEKDLPQTGVTEDITVMFFIIVCIIVSIYAYKKIRDYRV